MTYISVTEAAKEKDCTRMTIYKAIDQGKIDVQTFPVQE